VEKYLVAEVRRLGGKNVLVVMDKGVRKAGLADTVLNLLKEENQDRH
jgi:alcohol dehydrogenase class IV